jgi:hypothetical protein
MIDIGIKYIFCRQFAKSANMTSKFPEKSIWITKSAELYADFKFVDADYKKCS